jgi:hypothetical protein
LGAVAESKSSRDVESLVAGTSSVVEREYAAGILIELPSAFTDDLKEEGDERIRLKLVLAQQPQAYRKSVLKSSLRD